jgi:ligand-binding sensor domain-containing protein
MICDFFRWRFVGLLVPVLSLSRPGAATNSGWFAHAWQTEDGLPEHTIVGLEQTPDGYLWIATHRSLSRFDGVRFQEFAPRDAC